MYSGFRDQQPRSAAAEHEASQGAIYILVVPGVFRAHMAHKGADKDLLVRGANKS